MKKTVALLLVFAMVICLAACGKGGDEEARGVRVYVESSLDTLDPYDTDAYVSMYVWSQIYEALVRADENGEIIPWLAKEWTVEPDGMTYHFTIQEGVKFHNGEELKASDVVYSMNYAKSTAMMSYIFNEVDRAEVTGDYTFDMYMLTPSAAIIARLVDFYIVNEKYYSTQSNKYDTGMGTGAYKLREGSVDLKTEIVLDAFEDYHLGKPAIPTATLKIISDASTARVQMETGELDFLMVYSVSNYEPLASTGKYNTSCVAAPHCAYIAWNLEKEPLDNVALRQALTLATDKATINKIAYEGLAVPATQLWGPASFGSDFSDAVDMSFNLEAAKAKMAEAGFPNGLDFDDYGVSIDYIPGSYHEKIANCLQEMWAQIGVHVSIQGADNVDTSSGNYTMRTTGLGFTADMATSSDKYTSDCIGSSNYARYRNDRVDELFALAGRSADQAERAAAYKEICEIVNEECPYLCIQNKQIPYVWAKDLNAKVYPSNSSPWYIQDWSWKTE